MSRASIEIVHEQSQVIIHDNMSTSFKDDTSSDLFAENSGNFHELSSDKLSSTSFIATGNDQQNDFQIVGEHSKMMSGVENAYFFDIGNVITSTMN